MPLPTSDILLEHVGGLCAAWLRDMYGVGAVETVYTYPVGAPPAGKLPALVVTREAEAWTGFPCSRRAAVTVGISYYPLPHAGAEGAAGGGWYALPSVARQIDRALHKGQHPDWFAGVHIGTLTGMETAMMSSVAYPAPPNQEPSPATSAPSVQVLAEVQVRDRYETAVSYDAELLVLDYNSRRKLSTLLPVTEVYDAPKHLILTPLEQGVLVELTPGGALSVVEDDRIITITFVAGTTTVDDIAAAVAANPAAAAYLDLTGSTPGTLPALYAGGVFSLYVELVPAGAWIAPLGQEIPV